MNSKSMHHLNIDFIKPMAVLFIAHMVSLTNVTEWIKFASACVALAYGCYKLYKEIKKK